jgi:alanine-glyoxylate transaminase/serine-glyoxylate transaminase/serine-pyruvate transaminase
MTAYLERRPSYFGTPAVNLVEALNVSLTEILAEGMEARFARHRRIGRGIRAALNSMGLNQVPDDDSIAANTLSAPYYPEGVDGSVLLKEIAALGVTLAGGLHPVNRQKYFRIGHMGVAAGNDLISTIAATGRALNRIGYRNDTGAAINALNSEL